MKEDIAYSDMAQFHTNFLTQHFKWLQEEDEVANNPGLYCQKILVMRKDLVELKVRINWNSFGDYGSKNLEKLSDEKKEKQKIERKSEAFIEYAITSLNN
jgi:hypothetical protein